MTDSTERNLYKSLFVILSAAKNLMLRILRSGWQFIKAAGSVGGESVAMFSHPGTASIPFNPAAVKRGLSRGRSV